MLPLTRINYLQSNEAHQQNVCLILFLIKKKSRQYPQEQHVHCVHGSVQIRAPQIERKSKYKKCQIYPDSEEKSKCDEIIASRRVTEIFNSSSTNESKLFKGSLLIS